MNPQGTELPLRDIHLPDAVSIWPPAIGWWILLALIIAAVFLLPKLIRYLRQKSLRKIVLQTFERDVAVHKNNPQQLLQAASAFMRQLSMSYQGRQRSASLVGEAWLEHLQQLNNQTLPTSVRQLLIQAPYQPSVNFDTNTFINDCRHWLKKLPKNADKKGQKNA